MVRWGVLGAGGFADKRAIPGLLEATGCRLQAVVVGDLDSLNPAFEASHVNPAFYKYYCTLNLDRLRVDRDGFVKAVRAEGVPIAIGTSAEVYLEKVFQEQVGYGNTGYPFKNPLYKGAVDYKNVHCPNARKIGREAFVLLVHPAVEQVDLDDVIAAIRKVGNAYSV